MLFESSGLSKEKIKSRILYQYDDDNNLIGKKKFGKKSRLISSSSMMYNKGRLKEEVEERVDRWGGFVKEVNKYDEEGNMVKSLYFDKNDTKKKEVVIHNNSAGLKIKTELFTEKNGLENRTTFEYDEAGNLLMLVIRNAKGKETLRSEKKYDSNGNEIFWMMYSDGVPDYKRTFRFNEKNEVIDEQTYDSKNFKLETDTKFSYEYDDKGNWIKRIAIYKIIPRNGTLFFITNRDIKYVD